MNSYVNIVLVVVVLGVINCDFVSINDLDKYPEVKKKFHSESHLRDRRIFGFAQVDSVDVDTIDWAWLGLVQWVQSPEQIVQAVVHLFENICKRKQNIMRLKNGKLPFNLYRNLDTSRCLNISENCILHIPLLYPSSFITYATWKQRSAHGWTLAAFIW